MHSQKNFLDIHTHKQGSDDEVLAILNLMPGDAPPEKQYFSSGIHPWRVGTENPEAQFRWLYQLTSHPRLIAIGECGIDMLRPNPEAQKKIFENQVEIATGLNKPMILHAVRSHTQLIALKRSFRPAKPWIVHGFSSRRSIACQYLDAGFYLSFGAALLRRNEALTEAFRYCPDDRIFLETDDNGMSLRELYARAAALRGIGALDLASVIWRNFAACFSLQP
ncbi:MAG: TatD family hydrolase [Bacteroidetes bacterium]|nr:TatD family hydrolase [Bacteroidota bacterium]